MQERADRARPANRPRQRSGGNRPRSGRPDRGFSGPGPDQTSQLDHALKLAAGSPAPAAVSFGELGLPTRLVTQLTRRGIHAPFTIQARAMPDALDGRDVLGRAQAGSGKTLAFGLPLLARLADKLGQSGQRRAKAPRGLVLVPTRELAQQVADVLAPLGHGLALRIAAVYGGAPYGRQIDQLSRGVDVVVATPGRLIDLLDRGSCTLQSVEIAVLDEADHMADLGFLPAVQRILDVTPPDGQRLLFSATLDRGVDRLVHAYLTDPAIHAVAPAAPSAGPTDHRVFVLPSKDRVAVAGEIVQRPGRTLFFVRTKHGADRLAKQLSRNGVAAAAIHGNLSQNRRQRALDGFAAGHPRVLVATDVAARGIHVDHVDLVIHFDPPNDHKDYLHRSGRTGRAGATGTVVAFVDPSQLRTVERVHDAAGVTPSSHRVQTGHRAVRDLATSGTPVPPPAARSSAPTRSSAGSGKAGSPPHKRGSRDENPHRGAIRHAHRRPKS